MKCKCNLNLIKFLIFLIFINHLTIATSANLKKELPKDDSPLDNTKPEGNVDKVKLIQCKICNEMFDFDFNYEVFLKSKKVNTLQKAFEPLDDGKKEMKGYFSKDNMEFVTKEISMQYFFKGSESQSDEVYALKSRNCKAKSGKEKDECDQWKLQVCEKILGFEQGICVNIKSHYKELLYQSRLKPENNPAPVVKNTDENILNFKKLNFIQKEIENSFNDINNLDKDSDNLKHYANISLLELSSPQDRPHKDSPNGNLNSNNKSAPNPNILNVNNFDTTAKSHWKPPKPLILQNFQSNIADQLKDISTIATEISTLEKRVKSLKQQLANKLEIAQSSYNVVAKTLTEISKMVNTPGVDIGQNKQVTEDDWDEGSKPRFVK